MSTYGGGVVQGDVVDIDVACGPSSRLFLGTQANTRVYATPHSQIGAQHITGSVAADALAVFVPDPLVPHADSSFNQSQHWQIDPGAGLVAVDWTCSGRYAAGERFAFDQLRSDVIIDLDGKRLVTDRMLLSPASLDPRNPAVCSTFNHYVNMYVVGAMLEEAWQAIETAIPATTADAHLLAAGSAIGPNAWMVRAAARKRRDLAVILDAAMTALSAPALLDCNPLTRKY
jgi:urease accessory protein